MAELRFPVRDPGDDLATELGGVVRQAVADGQLTDTDAPVVSQLGRRLILDGARTFEDVLDRLEGLGAAGQRQWLDDARQSCCLPTATELERRRADAVFERELDRLQPPAPPKWSPLQRCAVCGTYPMDESGWKRVSVERWHCPKHELTPQETPFASRLDCGRHSRGESAVLDALAPGRASRVQQ